MIRRIALLLVLAFVGATEGLHAQRFAVSANLPALLTGTISVEPSVALGDRTSLQLSFSARPGLFKLPMPVGLVNTLYGHLGNVGFSERLKWGSVEHAEMAAFSPALRYWTKGVYNRGFFVSGHALGMVYRFGGGSLSRTYSEGFLVGAGALSATAMSWLPTGTSRQRSVWQVYGPATMSATALSRCVRQIRAASWSCPHVSV